MDALSADYTYINPYNYAENNPIINIDLHGLQAFNAIQNGLIGNDAQGYIRAATDQTREYSPFKASVADATFFVLDFIGLNAVDNAFFGDAKTSTAEKVSAVAPLLFNTKGGVDDGARATGKALPTKSGVKPYEIGSKASGQGGDIEGAYVEGDFAKMNDYAQQKLKESNPKYKKEYDKDRKPYSLTGNNCATFGCDVLKQDPEAKKNAPWIFNPTPKNVADEYQDNFPKVNYNSGTRTTTSDIYKKED